MSQSTGSKPARAVRLTRQALELIENALQTWWTSALEEQDGLRSRKLTRERKAERLDINVKTWDAVAKNEGADLATLKHILGTLGIVWRSDYCLQQAAPERTHEAKVMWGSAPGKPGLIVGRDADMAALRTLLCEEEMDAKHFGSQKTVVIRGLPGVGKTTLAAAMAHDPEIRAAYPDGILWAELGTSPSVESKLSAWGHQIGLNSIDSMKSVQDASAQLAAALQDRRMLLIVDDVWQQGHAIPFTVGGQYCALIITTREIGTARALAPTADDVYYLKELQQKDAVDLINMVAGEAVLEHHSECLELCRELDGLPLALKVAGRLLREEADSGLDVSELLTDLRAGRTLLESTAPADRADVDRHTVPTVELLLRKSTDRLDPITRNSFAQLGICAPKPATFGIPMLEHIWSTHSATSIIRTLVGRGLIEALGAGRFQLHALLLAHARSLLASSDSEYTPEQARFKSVDFYLNLAREADVGQTGPDQKIWLDTLETEHLNFREVLQVCQTNPTMTETGLQIAVALGSYWEVRGSLAEGAEFLTNLLDKCTNVEPMLRLRALNRLGILRTQRGELQSARAVLEQALSEARKLDARVLLCDVLLNLGNVLWYEQRLDEAKMHYEECLELARSIEDNGRIANALGNLGGYAWAKKDYNAALELYKEDYDVRVRYGDRQGIANALGNLGEIRVHTGDIEHARKNLNESIEIRREIGDQRGIALVLDSLAQAARRQGELTESLDLMGQALRQFYQIGDMRGTAEILESIAAGISATNLQLAVQLLEAASTLRKVTGLPALSEDSNTTVTVRAAVSAAISESAVNHNFGSKEPINVSEAVALALDYLAT